MIEKKYKIGNKRIKIALFADLHYTINYKKEILDEIIVNLKKNKPDYICIPGDIIDDASVIDDYICKKSLIEFISNLSLISKVILSYGNHDEIYIKNKKVYKASTSSFFNSLNEIKNVYFLDNKSIRLDNINFIGFRPDDKYYIGKEKEIKNYNVIEELIDKDCYNILLCHSPIRILDYNLNIDLVLSGHMHNGLVPNFMDKIGNIGFVGPYKTLFRKNSRGKIKKNKTILIITGGIIKISNSSSKHLRFLNKIYKSNIDYIEI